MRAIWSGAISFGLVNIPVKLYSASGENTLDFHMLAKGDHSPIKYVRIAASDGREVSFKDIVKGYEIEKGRYVILTDKDFETASAKKTSTINIFGFVNEKEIDPIYFEKPYFLEPDKSSSKPYALLREALRKSSKVGIASFVMRNREHLAIIKTSGNVIILEQMRYHDELRDSSELNLPDKKDIPAKETEMALKLIEQLTESFNPEQYKDSYIDELKKLIEAKSEGKVFEVEEEERKSTRVADLMDVLKESLKAAQSTKSKQRSAVKKEKTSSKNKVKKK